MGKKERLQQKMLRQQALLDAAKAAGRNLSAEEQREFDNLQGEIDTLKREIAADENSGDTTGVQESAQRAIAAERERIQTIQGLGRDFDMDVTEYVSNGSTVEAVREAVIAHMRQNSAPIATRANVINDEQDKFRSAASDALLMRAGLDVQQPADGSRELRGMSLRDLAIESLQMEGGYEGLNRRSNDEIYQLATRQFFNPTTAFPAILDQAINKAYVEGHRTTNVTFDRWTKKGSLPDFKTADNNYLAGPAGEFLEVPEGGELKHDVFDDAKRPTRKLKTYGRQFTLTRQAFINDDIGLVTRVPAKYAASARKTINKQCCQILVNNPAIYDGTALFSAGHKNLMTTGSGIEQAVMQKMILALQTQTDEFGESIIVRPGSIVLPSGLGFDIYTLFNSSTINTSGNTQAVNPLFRYASQIEIIEEPTINVLSGGFGNIMPWFLMGNQSDTEFIEVDYLNGQEIPTIRRMEAAGTLGFVWDIFLDWGISVMDYRGAVKNPGIAINSPL